MKNCFEKVSKMPTKYGETLACLIIYCFKLCEPPAAFLIKSNSKELNAPECAPSARVSHATEPGHHQLLRRHEGEHSAFQRSPEEHPHSASARNQGKRDRQECELLSWLSFSASFDW